MTDHPLPWNETAKTFLLAGRCVVTLEDVLTERRWTYSIRQRVDMGYVDDKLKDGTVKKRWTVVKRHPFWKVYLKLAGVRPFVGTIDAKLVFRAGSGIDKRYVTAESINMIGDVLRDLNAGTDRSNQVRIWHRGLCGRCEKTLTVPSSIATGIGPDCAKRMGISMVDTTPNVIEKIAALDDNEHEEKVA